MQNNRYERIDKKNKKFKGVNKKILKKRFLIQNLNNFISLKIFKTFSLIFE